LPFNSYKELIGVAVPQLLQEVSLICGHYVAKLPCWEDPRARDATDR
jgi:hypothetical protein